MAAKRDRVWTYDRVLQFYQRARRRASCGKCGKRGFIEIGYHPSGRGGQPVRVVGADPIALKKWIREAGWRCRSCKHSTADADGSPGLNPRRELAGIRKRLAPLRKAKQTPDTCALTLGRTAKMLGPPGVKDLEERTKESGVWMEPGEFQALLDREQELNESSSIS